MKFHKTKKTRRSQKNNQSNPLFSDVKCLIKLSFKKPSGISIFGLSSKIFLYRTLRYCFFFFLIVFLFCGQLEHSRRTVTIFFPFLFLTLFFFVSFFFLFLFFFRFYEKKFWLPSISFFPLNFTKKKKSFHFLLFSSLKILKTSFLFAILKKEPFSSFKIFHFKKKKKKKN